LGILQVYDRTVSQEPYKSSYDFRSPALKLTFDFQRAVKISHQRFKSVAGTFSEHTHNPGNTIGSSNSLTGTSYNEAATEASTASTTEDKMKEVLHGMLKEVSENADQLEEDMQQNMIVFSSDDGRVETVLKLGKDQNENGVTLIDQDNNEYVMMRPSDTTVIIEG
jgi:hypothetical protein